MYVERGVGCGCVERKSVWVGEVGVWEGWWMCGGGGVGMWRGVKVEGEG